MESLVLPILYVLIAWMFFSWAVCKRVMHRSHAVLWGLLCILAGPLAYLVIRCADMKHARKTPEPAPIHHEDPYHDLYTVRQMYTQGHITEEEYESHTQRLLRKI